MCTHISAIADVLYTVHTHTHSCMASQSLLCGLSLFEVKNLIVFSLGLYPPPPPTTHTIKDSIFISHYFESRNKDYKREVENIAKHFKHRGHSIWFGPTITGPKRDQCISSAETILVIFNEEYQKADLSFLHHSQCSCITPDILSLKNLVFNVNGGRQRIIPVVLDKCPLVGQLPSWLTSVPKIHYPSQKEALVYTVQRVKEYEAPKIAEVRRVKPKVINKDAVIRRFGKKCS